MTRLLGLVPLVTWSLVPFAGAKLPDTPHTARTSLHRAASTVFTMLAVPVLSSVASDAHLLRESANEQLTCMVPLLICTLVPFAVMTFTTS